MIAGKQVALKPPLESSDGTVLITYLTHRAGNKELKSQILETLHVAQVHWQPVMNRFERQK